MPLRARGTFPPPQVPAASPSPSAMPAAGPAGRVEAWLEGRAGGPLVLDGGLESAETESTMFKLTGRELRGRPRAVARGVVHK